MMNAAAALTARMAKRVVSPAMAGPTEFDWIMKTGPNCCWSCCTMLSRQMPLPAAQSCGVLARSVWVSTSKIWLVEPRLMPVMLTGKVRTVGAGVAVAAGVSGVAAVVALGAVLAVGPVVALG